MSARILLISGSLRGGSTNAAVVTTAASLELPGIETVVFNGIDALPHFNPDDDFDPLPDSVLRLRTAIREAHGLLFCTPEYAGALPGSFKNLLDWTIGGDEMYEQRVGWINAAPTGRGLNAHDSLRKVLGYASTTIVEDACLAVPVPSGAADEDGVIGEPRIRTAISEALIALAKSS